MQLPLEVTFRDMEPSPALESAIQEKANKLDRYYDRIMSCRVVIDLEGKHRHQGKIYRVRIDITVPDGELAVTRDPGRNHAHEDPYVAVRDAFEAARRQLEAYAHKRRGDVKSHDAPPHGRVSELNPGENFGRIETADGRQIYFHRNSVIGADFKDLQVGSEVRFVEENGDMGPQASTVKLVGKHHIHG